MIKKILILFLFFTSLANAEKVKEFKVEGNSRISSETIKVYGEIELDKDYDAITVNKIIKNLYSTNFFEDIQVNIKNEVLQIYVKEYPLINSIELNGEKSKTVTKSVLEKLSLKSKESFIESKLNEDVNLLKKIYASLGYNFATVEIKLDKFPNNRINLIYNLDKGSKTYINKISFIGDKKIKEKKLRDIIVSEEKKFWKVLSKNTFFNSNAINLDKRLLENYYKSIGYYDVQVLSSNVEIKNKNNIDLIYTINAGTRYKFNKIRTNVSEPIDKKIFLNLEESYKKLIGNYYSPFKVKKLLDELDIIIVNNELQFIEHSVNEILEQGKIELVINIYEGKKLLVEKINIFGNSITEESVIRSSMLLDEGDPFNKLKLDQSISKLKSLNIFGEVDPKILDGTTADQKIIEVKIEEKPTGEISAGAGIGTAGGSFAFNVTENNWQGKGIGVSTFAEVSKETFTGGLIINNPNYNFSGNSLNYFIQNTKNDKPDSGYKNSVLSSGINLSFEQYKNIYLSPGLEFSYDNLEVLNTASDSLKKQKGTFSDLSFKYGISQDNRDRAFNPTSGYLSSFTQSLPIYADAPNIRNSYQFSYYNSLNDDMIGALKFYATAVNSLNDKDVRLSKRAFLASNKLRGFESGKVGPKDGLDFIGGNYATSMNLEVNLPNLLPESTKTDVSTFLDFGNVWGIDYAKNLDDSNKIRSTAGVSINWLSPVGPMSFIFSQNLSKASTDVTESFNFRLGTTF
jgi:outer membrane protein insertion porin family